MMQLWEVRLVRASLFIMQFGICQEKPIHHPLSILSCHSRMISQILFHVGEGSFDSIICVWHTYYIFKCEQVG